MKLVIVLGMAFALTAFGQQANPPAQQPDGQAARIRHVCCVDQRLDLDEQRSRAFLGRKYARPGHLLLVMRKKQGRGIRHATQPAIGHRKHAEFVDRAVAVLDRAHHAEGGMRVPLEIKHRVDHVLEDSRSRERPVLGHMTD